MAETILNFNVEAGKDFFHVYDRTGKYDKKSNKGGWGNPNNKLSEVKEAKVRLYFPQEETFKEVDVFPYLPNTDCIGMEIIPEDFGMDLFDPGIYKFELLITLYSGVVLSDNCYIFFYQPLECCISKKKYKTNLNDASSEESKKVIELEALLDSAKYLACSGNMDGASEISDYIWINCGCCC